MGRLLNWKGFHLSLRAFAQFHREHEASEYWLIGDGPERKNLMSLVQKLGIADSVRFWGTLPRERVLELLDECDVLAHPSLHDSGGWVCLEAMAAKRPVICLDLGGPALQVTSDTGIKIPVITPTQVVYNLADAMLKLARNPVLRANMGEKAQQRICEEFSWDVKCQQMQKFYHEVLNRG